MKFLKQSTASQSRLLGPFVDDTDGTTAETGLSIANTDIRLSANGGNMASKNSGGGTHDELGYYTVTYDATDTATVGSLKVVCKMSGALVVEDEFWVLEEAIYDALFGASATGLLPANVTQVSGSSTAADNVEVVFDTDFATNYNTTNDQWVVSSSAVASVTGNVGGSVASVTGNVGGNVTGSVGSVSGITFPTNFGDLAITSTTGRVTVGTNNDKTGYSISGTLTTLDALDTAQDSQHSSTQSQISALNDLSTSDVDARLAAIGLDHLVSASVTGTDVADNSIIAKMVSSSATADWDSYVNTTESLQALRDRGDSAWITATGFSTFNAGSDTVTVGAYGASLDFNSTQKASINTEVDNGIVTYHLDHLLAADYDPASKPGTATALLNELVENDGGVSRFTANSLEQAPSGGTNPNVLVDTTVASISSQTVFVLTAGADFDDAYNDQTIVLYDASNNDYPSVRVVTDYVGSTKTVTIDTAPDFTLAASGDGVRVFSTAPGTSAPTAAQVADAVWDELQADHTTAGTFGLYLDSEVSSAGGGLDAAGVRAAVGLASANLDTQLGAIVADTNELQGDWTNGGRLDLIIDAVLADTGELQTNQGNWLTATGFSTHSAADVWAAGTRTLTANTNLNDPTASAIADAVWDEVVSGHVTNGTYGKAFSGATAVYVTGIAGTINTLDSLDTAQDSQHSTTQSAISALSIPTAAQVRTEIDSNSTQLAAIVADTNELQTDWANGGRLDLIVDAILADTANLNDTAIAEITGAASIPATPTIRQAVMLVYMWLRNNSQSTSSERRVFNDAGTEVLDATISDDGTTFSQGKLGDA